MEEFNQNIVGLIAVLVEFRGDPSNDTAIGDSDLGAFARNYRDSDLERVRFAWNGLHGEELVDPNSDFRLRLCEFIIQDFSVAGDPLIRDLYLELSKASRETWSVYRGYHLFAQELLNRGELSISWILCAVRCSRLIHIMLVEACSSLTS